MGSRFFEGGSKPIPRASVWPIRTEMGRSLLIGARDIGRKKIFRPSELASELAAAAELHACRCSLRYRRILHRAAKRHPLDHKSSSSFRHVPSMSSSTRSELFHPFDRSFTCSAMVSLTSPSFTPNKARAWITLITYWSLRSTVSPASCTAFAMRPEASRRRAALGRRSR